MPFNYTIRFLLLVGFYILLSTQLHAQCSGLVPTNYLRQQLGDYQEVKLYRLDGKGGQRKKIAYTMVLTPNTLYRFWIRSKEGKSKGIILTIYNAEKEVMTSNYDQGVFEETLDFTVQQKGIYYATFTFKKSKRYCGAALLGLKRQE